MDLQIAMVTIYHYQQKQIFYMHTLLFQGTILGEILLQDHGKI